MWQSIETLPPDREVWVSNGKYVMPAYLNGLGHLTWSGDDDTLLGDATHWTELAEQPSPSDGKGPSAADVYRRSL
jgi:hypothetical protein